LRDDDERLYHEYVTARLPQLRRLAFLICGDWHLAEDVVSTVLTKLYVGWRKVLRADSLDAYVRKMIIRSVVDERRRPWRRESPSEYGPPERAGADPTDSTADQLVLRDTLRLMPPRQRAVLVLRFYEGLNVAETATALGCSEGNVKSQTARGLAALRNLLPADYVNTYGATR
jgi:RNA polymerase sigma-70 factor (sigma-E family)